MMSIAVESHLLEPDDVRMKKGPVIDELSFHILVNLQARDKLSRHGCGLLQALSLEALSWVAWWLWCRASRLQLPARKNCTLSPRSMNLTATSSDDCLSRISLATPKLPLPISRICKTPLPVSACIPYVLHIVRRNGAVPAHSGCWKCPWRPKDFHQAPLRQGWVTLEW